MGNRAEYVKTGNSWLTRTANKLSLVPGFGAAMAASVGSVAVVWDSAKWLLRGKVGSAATELATGLVGHTINAINPLGALTGGGILWWAGAQMGTAVASGSTIGTHGRKVAEDIIGGITGALGMKPQVLQSYPAGIGTMPGAANYYTQPQGPGYWATRAAQQQGQDPAQRYAQYTSGEGRAHVEALRNAAMNTGQARGA